MSYLAPSTSSLPSTEIARSVTGNSPHSTASIKASIHVLDDESLLNLFYFYRPVTGILRGEQGDFDRLIGGLGWGGERWWYNLAHVCQRWRKLILRSPSFLDISLICTWGTPVADMLAHSPSLPLFINLFDHFNKSRDITSEEEKGISLALEKRDRVRRIRLWKPQAVRSIQKFIMAINEEYPVLEYLIMTPSMEDKSTALILPETFQAPHLRHLQLRGIALPIGSQLLTTAVGIVTLNLSMDHPSSYFQPNTLLRWISSMPQLETLQIAFSFPARNRDVERQPMPTPITTRITLPNLRWFGFRGVSAYMEAVVCRIAAPRLEKLDIGFFKQLTFSLPCLLEFMNSIENFRFNRAEFEFSNYGVHVKVYPEMAIMVALSLDIRCWHLDWQVSSMAQIFNSLGQIFSTVEHLRVEHLTFDTNFTPIVYPTLQVGHEVHNLSSEEHNDVDHIEWRRLFEPFSNVNSLRIDGRIAMEVSRCLQQGDGESPLELLPNLEPGGLKYSGLTNNRDALISFAKILDTLKARHQPTPVPVTTPVPVVPFRPTPGFVNPLSRSFTLGFSYPSLAITSRSSEAGSNPNTRSQLT